MSTGAKVFWVIVSICALIMVSATAAVAAAVVTSGLVTVRFDGHGPEDVNVRFAVPAALVSTGLGAVSLAMDGEDLEEAREALGEWGPAVAAAFAALEDSEDAVLVEVQDGAEHVVIEKVGRSLKIRVDSPDADVEVSVPADLVTRIVNAMS